MGAPSVTVANLPEAGMPYGEALSVEIDVSGAVAGAPGEVVPAGRRRIVTLLSQRLTCDGGHGALVQLFSGVGIFLPAQLAYTDSSGRDNYATTIRANFVMARKTVARAGIGAQDAPRPDRQFGPSPRCCQR